MAATRWHCRICRTWGLGGPKGWTQHHQAEHNDDVRLGAAISFGFSPNYANGQRTRYRDDFVPQPRVEER